jgi:hypothetical protein
VLPGSGKFTNCHLASSCIQARPSEVFREIQGKIKFPFLLDYIQEDMVQDLCRDWATAGFLQEHDGLFLHHHPSEEVVEANHSTGTWNKSLALIVRIVQPPLPTWLWRMMIECDIAAYSLSSLPSI